MWLIVVFFKLYLTNLRVTGLNNFQCYCTNELFFPQVLQVFYTYNNPRIFLHLVSISSKTTQPVIDMTQFLKEKILRFSLEFHHLHLKKTFNARLNIPLKDTSEFVLLNLIYTGGNTDWRVN